MKSIFSLLLVFTLSLSGQSQTDSFDFKADADAERLKVLIGSIGQTVQKNLDSMFRVGFTEVIRQQQLKADASPKGKPKDFIYESVVTNQTSSANTSNYHPIFTRTLISIDGKSVKGQPAFEDSKCEVINPQSAYESPLNFLLPKNQPNYVFSYGGETDFEGNKTVIINVAEKPPLEPVAIVEKDDCLFLSRPLQLKGKIWVDSKTFDVIQIQWQQAEVFSATIPIKAGKLGIIPLVPPKVTITYERQDFTIGFRFVKFQNPDQTLLIPYFSESVWINRGEKLAGMRTRIDYTQYKLFNTSVRVSDSDKEPNL